MQYSVLQRVVIFWNRIFTFLYQAKDDEKFSRINFIEYILKLYTCTVLESRKLRVSLYFLLKSFDFLSNCTHSFYENRTQCNFSQQWEHCLYCTWFFTFNIVLDFDFRLFGSLTTKTAYALFVNNVTDAHTQPYLYVILIKMNHFIWNNDFFLSHIAIAAIRILLPYDCY